MLFGSFHASAMYLQFVLGGQLRIPDSYKLCMAAPRKELIVAIHELDRRECQCLAD